MDSLSDLELLTIKFKDKIVFHPLFTREFEDFLRKHGNQEVIIQMLYGRLIFILESGKDYGIPWVESLKGEPNLYSLHIDVRSINLRLLYSRTSNKRLFLHAFYERGGKKNTSYNKSIQIAIERRESYLNQETHK